MRCKEITAVLVLVGGVGFLALSNKPPLRHPAQQAPSADSQKAANQQALAALRGFITSAKGFRTPPINPRTPVYEINNGHGLLSYNGKPLSEGTVASNCDFSVSWDAQQPDNLDVGITVVGKDGSSSGPFISFSAEPAYYTLSVEATEQVTGSDPSFALDFTAKQAEGDQTPIVAPGGHLALKENQVGQVISAELYIPYPANEFAPHAVCSFSSAP